MLKRMLLLLLLILLFFVPQFPVKPVKAADCTAVNGCIMTAWHTAYNAGIGYGWPTSDAENYANGIACAYARGCGASGGCDWVMIQWNCN